MDNKIQKMKNRMWNIEFKKFYFSVFPTSNFHIPNSTKKGFSLVEMIVSLGIFTIILFIATSAFLTVVNADRKSRATRIAMDNLNLTLEDMSRRIKTGSSYNCGANIAPTKDCSGGENSFKFVDQDNRPIIYKWAQGTGCSVSYGLAQGCILRTIPGDPLTSFMLATSPEIDITKLKFLVSGSDLSPDTRQPVVVVMIEGTLGVDPKKTTFKIQTTITQRKYDK